MAEREPRPAAHDTPAPLRRPGRIVARALPVLLLAAVSASAAPPAPPQKARPQRIMSLDMCDDLMLLMLVPKARIASISFLAHDAVAAQMPGRDAGIAINHGAAEDIVRDRPDLILASAWSTPVARRLAKRVGARLVETDAVNSFADVRRVLRQVAAAVGEAPRGEALIREMDGELARLAATRPARRLRVVAWSGDGSVPGRGSLTDAIITAAGAENIAAKYDDGRYSSFGLEELLVARPDAILHGSGQYGEPSLRRGVARHPLIGRLFAGRQVEYPAAAYTCGTPLSARSARQLRATLARVPAGAVGW